MMLGFFRKKIKTPILEAKAKEILENGAPESKPESVEATEGVKTEPSGTKRRGFGRWFAALHLSAGG